MTKDAPEPPEEIEWQLDALDLRPVERWLSQLSGDSGVIAGTDQAGTRGGQGAPSSPDVTVVPVQARRLVDSYIDTDDWRIGRSGYVLRVRTRARNAEATLKDTAPASAGLRRRVEITEPLPGDGLASISSAGPVGARIRALAGNRPLRQVLEVRTRRRPYTLRIGGDVVGEVALDDTAILVGEGQEPVRLRRVEVEVAPGHVDELGPVVERLRRECGLQPATLSKFEAGLLGAGLRLPPPPDLGPTLVGTDSSIGDVAYAVLRRNLSAMLAHEPGTRLGEDIEELHDMRVATRRLRAALALFADVLPVRAVTFRVELGWLAAALGVVRDLDVQLERLEHWVAEVPAEDRDALDHLAELLHHERRDARDELLRALDSARYERLVGGFATMLRQGPPRRSAVSRAPAVAIIPDLVRRRHRVAVRSARRARRSGVADDFHRLRIHCKRLRYALEFAADVYGQQTTPFIRRVVALQDALGLMQDAEVAATRLRQLALTDGRRPLPAATIFVMGSVSERYRREAGRLLRRLPAQVGVLRGGNWQKLSSLMERRRIEFGSLYAWPTPARRSGAAPPLSTRNVPAASSPPTAVGADANGQPTPATPARGDASPAPAATPVWPPRPAEREAGDMPELPGGVAARPEPAVPAPASAPGGHPSRQPAPPPAGPEDGGPPARPPITSDAP